MNHVHVIIPTLNRYQLLVNTVLSILKGEHKDVSITITIDANDDLFYRLLERFKNLRPKISLVMNEKRIGWGKSINKVIRMTDYDYYFYASDDLTFQPSTIKNALFWMRQKFPDGDGVVGIHQTNIRHFCPAAFGIVGREWLKRFPNRALFNPAYRHFCVDSELWRYAAQKKKFFLCSDAVVYHARPNDACHRLAQSTLQRDREIWRPRKASGRFYPEYP